MPARKNLRHIRAGVDAAGGDRRNKWVDALSCEDRQCKVKQENLYEQRRAAEELYIDLRKHPQETHMRDARDAHNQTDHKTDRRGEYRDLYGNPRTNKQQRE